VVEDLSFGTVQQEDGALLDQNGEQDSLQRVEIEVHSSVVEESKLELLGTMLIGVRVDFKNRRASEPKQLHQQKHPKTLLPQLN
jgi:hypothetical protein